MGLGVVGICGRWGVVVGVELGADLVGLVFHVFGVFVSIFYYCYERWGY